LSVTLLVGWAVFAIAGGYVLLNGPTGWLRRVTVADLTAIAKRFLLRAVAGVVAAEVSISGWFIVVVWFAALLRRGAGGILHLGVRVGARGRRTVARDHDRAVHDRAAPLRLADQPGHRFNPGGGSAQGRCRYAGRRRVAGDVRLAI